MSSNLTYRIELSDLINDKVRDVDPTASSSVAICFDIKGTDGEVETRWIKRKVGGNSSNSKYFMRENANVKWTVNDASYGMNP